MNENELYIVKENKFDHPLLTEINSLINKCFRDCYNNYFHKFKYTCTYDIKLTNITNNETINFTISDKSMRMYEWNQKLTVARQNGFLFNQIIKLSLKFYSHLRYINIIYYLKSQIPMCHRHFFRLISQNRDYFENFCNDRRNPFHFACHKWMSQLN